MTADREYRIAQHGDLWTLSRTGASEPCAHYLTRAQALDAARAVASRNAPSRVVVAVGDGAPFHELWTPTGIESPTATRHDRRRNDPEAGSSNRGRQ